MSGTTVKVKTAHIDIGPTGFIVYAKDYLEGYKAYNPEMPFSPAKYYLVCRSVELALKSYLSLKKIKIEMIKYKLGHDLIKNLNRAKELNINRVVEISSAEEIEIEKANSWYNRKGFEYFDIKNIVESEALPELDVLLALSERLIRNLHPLCLSSAQE
jgi:hypothetical protein